MMLRSFTRHFLLLTFLSLAFAPGAVRADSDLQPLNGSDPRRGFELAQAASSSAQDTKDTRLAEMLKQAADAYERAAFGVAVDWYDNALALSPDRADIRELLELSVKMRDLQKEQIKSVPQDEAGRETFLKGRYEKAKALYDQGDYRRSYQGFYQLWVVGGKYKDTLSLMGRAREKAGLTTEPPDVKDTPVAPVADAKPEPTIPDMYEKGAPKEVASLAKPAASPMVDLAGGSKAKADQLLVRADQLAKAGKADEARSLYEEALKADPQNKVVAYALSKLPPPSAAPKAAPGASAAVKAEEAAKKAAADAEAQRMAAEQQKKAAQEAGMKAEAEAKAKTAAEAKAKVAEEARMKAEADAKAKADEAARVKADSEAKLKAESDARAKAQAEAKAASEEAARLKSEAAASAKTAADARMKAESETKAKAEEAVRIKAEADAKLKLESEARAKAQAEAKAAGAETARMKADAEARAKSDAEARMKAEAEAKAKTQELEKLKADAEAKGKAAAQAEARATAAEQARMKVEADAKAAADQARAKADADAKAVAEQARMKSESDAKAAAEAEKARIAAEANAAKMQELEKNKNTKELEAQGVAALKSGNFDLAETSYRELLSIQPGNKKAVKGLENVASARAEQAEKDSKAQLAGMLAAGERHLSAGQYEEAAQQFEAVLQKDPKNKKAKSSLASAQQGLAEAKSHDAKRSASAALANARTYAQAGDFAGAREAVTNVLAQDPTNAEAQTTLREIAKLESNKASAEVAGADTGRKSFEVAQAAAAPAAPSEPPPAPEAKAVPNYPLERQGFVPESVMPSQAPRAAEAPTAAKPAEGNPAQTQAAELERLHREALDQFRKKDIAGARKTWEAILAIKPGDKQAETFMHETQADFDRFNATLKTQEESVTKREQARELLNSPVTVSTDRATPLSEFMRIISFSTATELQYYIADGASSEVFVNFVDKPLKDVLDSVLTPIGLVWDIDEKNMITVRSHLESRVFNLTADQLSKIRSLIESGDLQRVIWGQVEPPSKGVEMTVDERQRVLLAVGSTLHMKKIEDFMGTIGEAGTPDLETRIYKIRPEDGLKIKALINALIAEDINSPLGRERKVYIDGADLIIRDTPENIAKIEELLLDEKFIQDLRNENLDIANFNLIPRDVENQSSEQINVFTNRIFEAVQTFLYARTGIKAAQAEGRRMWFDPATFQLTVVDTPTNLGQVGRFIESLPELRRQKLQKVRFLENAVAEELAGQLSEVLGLTGGGNGKGGGKKGDQTVLKLRRGEQATFKDLRIRCMRIEEGDVNDRNDDEVELSIVSGAQQSNFTIRELETRFFEDYEITADDVQPSGGGSTGTASGSRGEGNCRLTIRYNADAAENLPGAIPTPPPANAAATAEEEEGLTISPFGALNALIIRYDNPSRLAEVEDLIVQLDKPTKQVEVETKFVQVNESRAKEISADFDLSGLGNDRSINTDVWRMGSRFGQFKDEVRDYAEPPIENPSIGADLLKGTTVLKLLLGDTPGISFQLRLLESEGVLNITNGPKVTMLDAIRGEFELIKLFPGVQFGSNNTQTVTQTGQGDELLNFGGARITNKNSPQVSLEVTPEITSEKSIILQIEAEILDLDSNFALPPALTVSNSGGTGGVTGAASAIVPPQLDPNPEASLLAPANFQGVTPFAGYILNTGSNYRMYKRIDTTARTHDGGTIVLGGWTGERAQDLASGVPVLRNMPYFGKLLFSRNQRSLNRDTLLIFLTANLID